MPKVHAYNPQDRWFLEAKKQGYRARSAFKLKEILEHYPLVRPGMHVLDIASAPGSWLQVLAQTVGHKGSVIGFDLQAIDRLSQQWVHTFVWDVFQHDQVFANIKRIYSAHYPDRIEAIKFDTITSDIAPRTTGIPGVDQARSVELDVAIFELAKQLLHPGGSLVLKVFCGANLSQLLQDLKPYFAKIDRYKPRATRDRSFEEYLICQKFRSSGR